MTSIILPYPPGARNPLAARRAIHESALSFSLDFRRGGAR